jgi:hypothetical protein
MTIEAFVDFYQKAFNRNHVLESDDATSYKTVLIPFAMAGVINLDDDNTYEVSLENLNNRTIEVHEFDSPNIAGAPIVFQRAEIKSNLSEKEEDVTDATYLFFPENTPSKIEFRVPFMGATRKVVLETAQMNFFKKLNRLTAVSSEGALSLGTSILTLDVLKTRMMTFHKEEGTEFVYYKVTI